MWHMMWLCVSVCVTKLEDAQRGSCEALEEVIRGWEGEGRGGVALSRPRRQIERMDDNFDLSCKKCSKCAARCKNSGGNGMAKLPGRIGSSRRNRDNYTHTHTCTSLHRFLLLTQSIKMLCKVLFSFYLPCLFIFVFLHFARSMSVRLARTLL